MEPMNPHARLAATALLAAAVLLSPAALAARRDPPTSPTGEASFIQESGARDVRHFNLDKHKLALSGYDPVAYFPEGGGKPLKGSDKITVTHKGVVYRFSSEATKALFVKTPDKFEPQYGGWCAYAMADDEKVEIDPKSFLITEGKLYLFYKSFFNDTRAKWLKDEAALAKKADAGWKKILEKPAPKSARAEGEG
jgi:YHS domain-containing protein